MAEKDLEEATLAKYGVKTKEQPKSASPLKPKPCPRCRNTNPTESKYCSHCSMILDEATALERMKKDKLLMKLIRRLNEMPDEDLKAFLKD